MNTLFKFCCLFYIDVDFVDFKIASLLFDLPKYFVYSQVFQFSPNAYERGKSLQICRFISKLLGCWKCLSSMREKFQSLPVKMRTFWSKHTNNKARESIKKVVYVATAQILSSCHNSKREFVSKETEILDAEVSLNLSFIESGSKFSVVVAIYSEKLITVRLRKNYELHPSLVHGNYDEWFVIAGTTQWIGIRFSIPFQWMIWKKSFLRK